MSISSTRFQGSKTRPSLAVRRAELNKNADTHVDERLLRTELTLGRSEINAAAFPGTCEAVIKALV